MYSEDNDGFTDVGAPYVIMDHMKGTRANTLRRRKGLGPGCYGTPKQTKRFKQEMAEIQTVISSHVFDKIGSFEFVPGTDYQKVTIGRDVESGQGPWGVAEDYIAELTDHLRRRCTKIASQRFQDDPTAMRIPTTLTRLYRLHHNPDTKYPTDDYERRKKGFVLTCKGFGPDNLLVDDDFHVIGVIDLEGLMSVPYDFAAQFPRGAGLEPNPPGYVAKPKSVDDAATQETMTDLMKEMITGTPNAMLKEYANMIGTHERTINSTSSSVGTLMLSIGALLAHGLDRWKLFDDVLHAKWTPYFERLYAENRSSHIDWSSLIYTKQPPPPKGKSAVVGVGDSALTHHRDFAVVDDRVSVRQKGNGFKVPLEHGGPVVPGNGRKRPYPGAAIDLTGKSDEELMAMARETSGLDHLPQPRHQATATPMPPATPRSRLKAPAYNQTRLQSQFPAGPSSAPFQFRSESQAPATGCFMSQPRAEAGVQGGHEMDVDSSSLRQNHTLSRYQPQTQYKACSPRAKNHYEHQSRPQSRVEAQQQPKSQPEIQHTVQNQAEAGHQSQVEPRSKVVAQHHSDAQPNHGPSPYQPPQLPPPSREIRIESQSKTQTQPNPPLSPSRSPAQMGN